MSEHLHIEFVPGCYRCDLSRYEFKNVPDLWASHIEKLAALKGVLDAARYVLEVFDTEASPALTRLREAVEAFDA